MKNLSTKGLATLMIASLAVIGLGMNGLLAGSAGAAPPEGQICPAGDSGKIDTTGDPSSVTVSAPAGNVITQYCVKAGSAQQDLGYVIVPVNPPMQTVTITHPSGKDVSHYSFSYEPIATTTESTTTTEPEDETTTTESTTTTTEPYETTTTTEPEDETTTTTSTTIPEVTLSIPDDTTTTTTEPEDETTTTTSTTIPDVTLSIPDDTTTTTTVPATTTSEPQVFGTVTVQTPDDPPPAPVVQPAVATNNDPAPSQGGQNLAVTGTSSSLALLGLGAVLFGLAATGAARRRQAEA